VHGSLLSGGLYDYAQLFVAPLFVGDGGTPLLSAMGAATRELAPRIITPQYQEIGTDLMISGAITYPS
jgi:riboflavin biosynthesis pyrimidine reductase